MAQRTHEKNNTLYTLGLSRQRAAPALRPVGFARFFTAREPTFRNQNLPLRISPRRPMDTHKLTVTGPPACWKPTLDNWLRVVR